MKVSCEIIEDLLPLYADDVCSSESRRAVQKHLQECPKCRKIAEENKAVIVPQIEPDRPCADRAIRKGFRKIRFRWWLSVLVILALIPVAFLGWNEHSKRGIAFSNQDELLQANAFVRHLENGDYAKAYSYLDLTGKRTEWLKNWFSEDKLSHMKEDGLKKFCELGEKVEAAGGIGNCEYVGISLCGVTNSDRKVYRVTYRTIFAGKPILLQVDASGDGVVNFSGGGSFLTDSLAQLSVWAEYLWQDYQGCYFDPETKTYVYYDKNLD